jgi:hypothetical protein
VYYMSVVQIPVHSMVSTQAAVLCQVSRVVSEDQLTGLLTSSPATATLLQGEDKPEAAAAAAAADELDEAALDEANDNAALEIIMSIASEREALMAASVGHKQDVDEVLTGAGLDSSRLPPPPPGHSSDRHSSRERERDRERDREREPRHSRDSRDYERQRERELEREFEAERQRQRREEDKRERELARQFAAAQERWELRERWGAGPTASSSSSSSILGSRCRRWHRWRWRSVYRGQNS